MISLPIVDVPVQAGEPVSIEFPRTITQRGEGSSTKRTPEYNLRGYLNTLLPLPLRTGLLGIDSNENPLLFDLMDPRPGAILIVSDREAGKMRLVKTLLYSLYFANPP